MNEITCRGCGRYESECTCNVLTKDNPNLKAQISDLSVINESHRKLNGELQARITELEALIPTKEEATFGICSFHLYDSGVCMQNCPFYKKQINPMEHCKGWSLSRDFSIKERLTSKLQKIIEKKEK